MKKKFLALALASSVMVMGAGYAFWTDQVTVHNSVTTGEFDVNFVDDSHYPNIFTESSGSYVGLDDKIRTQVLSAVQTTSKLTTIDISNMYPGSYAAIELKVQNNGTIPAVFDYSTVTDSEYSTDGLYEAMNVNYGAIKYNNDDSTTQLGATGYIPLSELKAHIDSILAGVTLLPGESVAFVGEDFAEGMELVLPYTVGDNPTTEAIEPNQFETSALSFDIQLNWKQHNTSYTTPPRSSVPVPSN